MPRPAVTPTSAPLQRPRIASLVTAAGVPPGLSSPSVMPRSVTASDWQPVLPDWPASTGRNTASSTIFSSVPSKAPTTPAATNAVSRLSCSQGWRNHRLRSHGVASRSSPVTPTIAPACAVNSTACASNIFWPRTVPRSRPSASTTG